MPTPEEGSPSGEPQQPPSSPSPPPDFRLPKAPQGAPPAPPSGTQQPAPISQGHRLPKAPQGAPPAPPSRHLPPQRPPAPAPQVSPDPQVPSFSGPPGTPAQPGTEEPLPDVRPSRLWYWVGGAIFPVNLLISILLLSNNPNATPGQIVGGILTPMLTFFVSLIICVTVLLVRSSRKARQRAERAQRERAAQGATVFPHPGQPVHMGHPGMAQPGMGYPGYVPAFPPAEISSKDIRPRRRWLVAGALALPLGIVLGILAIVWAATSQEAPEFASEVIVGTGTTTFEVTEDQVGSLGLYSTASLEEEDRFVCDLTGEGNPRFTKKVIGYSHDGWRLVESAEFRSPGQYTLDCEGPATKEYPTTMEYVIADTDVAVDFDNAMLAAVGTLMLSSFIGFVLSLTLLITVGIKRGNHRRKLLGEHRMRSYQAWAQTQGQNPHQY